MKAFRISALLVLLIMGGCVSLPSPEEMKADVANYRLPILPPDGKAIVYVVRPSSLGALIRFNVFVDSKDPAAEMGYTRGAQYIYFNLQPGTHKILSKAENWAESEVNVRAGDIIFIEQIPNMGFLMARNTLIKIEPYKGKYHVKRIKLGTIKKTDL